MQSLDTHIHDDSDEVREARPDAHLRLLSTATIACKRLVHCVISIEYDYASASRGAHPA